MDNDKIVQPKEAVSPNVIATDCNDFMTKTIQNLQLALPPARIYHYTSMDVLRHLLQDAQGPNNEKSNAETIMQFHISSAFYMNDRLEYNGLHSSNLSGMSRLNIRLAQWSMGLPYIMSLSANGDSIPMWNNYGDRGKGVCLCFDTEKLRNAIKENDNIFQHSAIYMCKYYDKNEKPQLFPELSTEDALEQQRETIRRIATMAFYKNKDWEYEEECRILVWANLGAQQKMQGEELISYSLLKIPISCLCSVTTGPCVSERTFDSLMQMIEQRYKGITNPTINKSESTLYNQ